METFRFESLEIWHDAQDMTARLFAIAELVEKRGRRPVADQLFRAAMSVSNNIAEGAGSVSKKDFGWFIVISRRSLFECVNLLHLILILGIIEESEMESEKSKLLLLSKKLWNFKESLKS